MADHRAADRSARVVLVATLSGALPLAPLAQAQPAGKVYHVGYLGSGSAAGDPRTREAFREGLRELGWVEGQNIVIDYRFAEGRPDRLPDPAYLLPGAAARLADLAAKRSLPSMHAQRAAVEAGGLMSYGPSIVAVWRRGAVFVDRILGGASPANLPVEQPTQFELVINLKTAKTLGLTIPPAVVARADEIIR